MDSLKFSNSHVFILQFSNMDLNKLPPDLDEDFLDAFGLDYVTGNPTFCTQVPAIPEIPQPNDEHARIEDRNEGSTTNPVVVDNELNGAGNEVAEEEERAKEEDSAQEEEDDQGEKKKKLDGCKKRKREKMIYTNCKARMVVKMIGSKWQVIYFLAGHNHDLVVKPSLKKFLSTSKYKEKCLVAQDGQDFRADENERRRKSRHPLEKHASTVYTKNMFYKFSKEFEKTVEYDVKPVGQFQYWVEPNNNFVYGYGKRNYLVTAIEEEESYCCTSGTCSPWDAIDLPKTLRFTNASTAFAALVVEGCTSDNNYAILEKHIKQMRSELDEIKKRKMTNRQNTGAIEGAQDPSAIEHWSRCSGWSKLIKCREPPKVKSQRAQKEKAHKKGMNGQAKRKNRCSICRSYDNNAQRCPDKPGREVQNQETI
ncbi:unnamed protein product [Miscanthus lutarioriparius]|uniref:Protein FAR1-RELATED SEQUENCE n=1 Tax=Miscanthus lutarioriparius TaxID=422564 RepID=A0A811M6V3_9POAL|nr:unnamed protein product [Miscanthus lutarioriparius]